MQRGDVRMWVRDDCGQTAVEYALVVATVAIVLALFLAIMPDVFGQFWSTVTGAL